MFFAHLGDLEAELLVLKLDTLGSGELMFNVDLFLAARVKAEETHGEMNCVFHVTFDLELD
jgi:hypothetical protein